MICPDCEFEMGQLAPRLGICKKCAQRKSTVTYQNKKNNTNKEYIPLKDLKKIKPNYYNNICNRRRKEGYKHINDLETKEDKSIIRRTVVGETEVDIKNTYYAKVYKDIQETFNNAKISDSYLEYDNLDKWVDTFFLLLQKDNFITDAKEAEIQLNNLDSLYDHALENADWSDMNKIKEISYTLKALRELRRPTKNILDFYYVVDPIITYLQKDEKFMKLLEDARITLKYKKDHHDNPKYMSRVDVAMARESDFVCGITDQKPRLYDCTVLCFNLNGNPNKSLFRAKNGIKAKNEAEAKLKLKNFLSNKFATVTYKDEDITIKEVNSVDEIEKV